MEEKFESQLTKVYPNGLTGKEIIRRITEIYHAGYDLDNPNFDIYDQLLACEVIKEAEEEDGKRGRINTHSTQEDKEGTNESVNVKWSVNDTYKRRVNFELTESKLTVVTKLQTCGYRTPPIEIAALLEDFFTDPNTIPGHWLLVAQTWPPKRINQVIGQMIKRENCGWKTIQKPAAYFTYLIKFRKKRKTGKYQ